MLGEKEWLPNKKVTEIIETILSMLISPDLGSAINLEAVRDVKEGTYEGKVKELLAKGKLDLLITWFLLIYFFKFI